MNRVEHEITARINRNELEGLLNTMTPGQQQAVTTRASIAEIEAELARLGVTEPAHPSKTEAATARPKRKYKRPFSQVAALLPAYEPIRAQRPKRPSQLPRAKTNTSSLAVAEKKAPRTVAELRARLDSGETPAMWAASCELSPQVLAHLTAEEIAMLPGGIRASLPEVPGGETPPRSEMASVPAEIVDLPSEHGAALVPAAEARPQRLPPLFASLAVLFLVGFCAVYFLI